MGLDLSTKFCRLRLREGGGERLEANGKVKVEAMVEGGRRLEERGLDKLRIKSEE